MKPTKKQFGKRSSFESKRPQKHISGAKAPADFAGDVQGLKPLPPSDSQLVEIEKPIYGGAFLARADGKAVFVPLTLPGEQARVRITQSKRGYDTADPDEIIRTAPERIAPACPYFGACGGCHYQHANYEAQLAFKQTILRETLERGGVQAPKEISVLAAEPWHYRNRIRLALDAAGNPGYRARRSNDVVSISECPIAAPLLIESALTIAEVARQAAPALHMTEISLFCNSDETALLIGIFTESAKKNSFDELAQALHERIPALCGADLAIEGRAGQQPRTIAQWGATSLTYRAAGFDYRVDQGAFFQVNRWLVDALVERVISNQSGTLAWDLFAGVGLFARQLTQSFSRVVAVENSPSATQALTANLKGTTGIPVRASTLDFLRRNRKPEQPDAARPDLIVLDPPRTGLGEETCALLAEIAAPSVVCVSCDPATLARDLRALIASGYAIHSMTLADLFPQTFHLETVVQLRRS
jgi:23S rRNA (uracil1939-C5)-methyltransferase